MRRRPGPLIWCALSKNEAEVQRGDMGRSAQDRGICPGIFGLRHFLIGCDQEVPEKLPCPFPSLLFPTLDSLNDGNKMSRNQRLTCSCWTMRYLSARVEGEQLILFKARDVSLTRRDGRSDVVKGPPEPGWWESDWWLLCRDGSLGPRRRPQRAGWARARPDPGSRLASGGDRSRMAMLVFRLSVACLHHAVSRVLAWYLPTEYCVDSGGTEVQKPREIGQAFCGGTGGEDGNLGSACRCRPSDAGRVCLTGHLVRRPARKCRRPRLSVRAGGRRMDGF